MTKKELTKIVKEALNEVTPPGKEDTVKALKGKVDNPWAVAWSQYNKEQDKDAVKKEELSAWDVQQAEKKKKAEEYRRERDAKIKSKGADSSMKITKEHLTKIVKEAIEETDGGSWWDKKKKEIEDKKKEKSGDSDEVKKEELSITKEHLMKIIQEEVEKLMEEPQVSSGVQGAGEEEDKGEHYQSLEEADSLEDELRSGSKTRETEGASETPPRTLKEVKLLARPKRK